MKYTCQINDEYAWIEKKSGNKIMYEMIAVINISYLFLVR